MSQIKNIGYAYPSSILASVHGHAKTGCFYLSLEEDTADDFSAISVVFASPDKEAVVARSWEYSIPWGNYSMHKESEDRA